MYSIVVEAKYDRDKIIHRSIIFKDLTLVEAVSVLAQVKDNFIQLYDSGVIAGVQNVGTYGVRAVATVDDPCIGQRGVTVDYIRAELSDNDNILLIAVESCLLINFYDPKNLSS